MTYLMTSRKGDIGVLSLDGLITTLTSDGVINGEEIRGKLLRLKVGQYVYVKNYVIVAVSGGVELADL